MVDLSCAKPSAGAEIGTRHGARGADQGDILPLADERKRRADVSGLAGGTGAPFDWHWIEGRTWPVPLFLSGGLRPENVAESIRRTRPSAVDVASGVESSPGVKDPDRMRRFFDAVRKADAGRDAP